MKHVEKIMELMRKSKAMLMIGLLTAGISFGLAVVQPPSVALAGSKQEEACAAIGGKMDTGECTAGTSINKAIKTVINILTLTVGIVSVIMLIYGGFRFVTSGGDPSATKAARSTIVYALIGVAVASLSQILAQFVLGKV